MSREVSQRFAHAKHPRFYEWMYGQTYNLFEHFGGINIVAAKNLPPPGKKIVTANHESLVDPFLLGVVDPEALFSVGKKELKSWRYGFAAGWILEHLLNAELLDRKKASHNLLGGIVDILNNNQAVLSYLYGTRKHESKEVPPKEGIAWMALKATTELEKCPVVPIGHSTGVWRPGRPIQVVIGEALYPPEGLAEMAPPELRLIRKEMTEELANDITTIKRRAEKLDSEGAGITGKVQWHL